MLVVVHSPQTRADGSGRLPAGGRWAAVVTRRVHRAGRGQPFRPARGVVSAGALKSRFIRSAVRPMSLGRRVRGAAVAAESGEARAQRFMVLAEEHQAEADKYRRLAQAVEKGNDGEHAVARLLDVLDGAGWRVLNDRYKAPGSPANLDHVAIGPPGVFVIDAKNWAAMPLRLDERGMAIGRYRRDDVLSSARECAAVVASHSAQASGDAVVYPVLAFVQDMGLRQPQLHQGVALLQIDQLLTWLTAYLPVLDAACVARVASTLDAALPPRVGRSRPFDISQMPQLSQKSSSTGRPVRRSQPTRQPTAPPRPPAPGRPDHNLPPLSLRRRALLFCVFIVVAILLSGLSQGPRTSLPPAVPPISEGNQLPGG